MSTPLVISATDELVAELEAIAQDASFVTSESDSQEYLANLATRLLAERAELLRDARRYRWLIENSDMMHWENMLGFADLFDDESVGHFIDAAMQSEAKP